MVVEIGVPVIIRQTSDPNKFVVRTYNKEGVYRQELLTRSEITSRGGNLDQFSTPAIPESSAAISEGKPYEFTPIETKPEPLKIPETEIKREPVTEPTRESPLREFRTKDGYIVDVEDLRDLEKDNPKLAFILKTQGYEAYRAAEKKEATQTLKERQRQLEEWNEQVEDERKQFETDIAKQPEELRKAYEEGGIIGYNKAVEDWNKQAEQERQQFELELTKQPRDLREAYEEGGIEGYNKAVEKWNEEAEEEREKFEAKLKEQPEELQKAYNEGGIDAFNKAVDRYNTELIKDEQIHAVALKGLEPYKAKDDSYDIQKYIQDARKKGFSDKGIEETLINAGFKDEEAKSAIEESKLSFAQRTWRGMTPWDEAKGETVTLKGAGEMAAVALVPGVWLKDVKNMKPWQVGLNAGLDLLILVPVVGWGAQMGSKVLVKAGTGTIQKSLAKELPRALTKAGEKSLAKESVAVARNVGKIEKSMESLQKAARATVKAEKSKDVDKFVQAVANESAAKMKFANDFRRVGADIGQLNAKLEDTTVGAMSRQHLNKAVGMSSKADDFAEYLADVEKEIARVSARRTVPQKMKNALTRQITGYGEAVNNIKDIARASGKTITRGKKAGAAYLRGEGKPTKVTGTATEAYIKGGQKEVNKYLDGIEKQLARESARQQAKLAKYGSRKTLDQWDRYIKETWRGGGGYVEPRPVPELGEISPTLAGEMRRTGRVATVTKTGAGATRPKPSGISHTYTFPLTTVAGSRVFTVLVNPQTGETTIVPDVRTITPEKIKPSEVTRPEVEPAPEIKPEVEPAKAPEIKPITRTTAKEQPKITPAEKREPKPVGIPKQKPIAEIKPKPEPKPEEKLKGEEVPKVKTKLGETYRPLPKPIPPPPAGASESETRKFLAEVGGVVARRRGELHGKSVWLIDFYPYGPKDKMVLLGEAPEGAKPVTGKGSLKESITLLRGIPPKGSIYRDTGAVDDIISTDGKKVRVHSVKDRSIRKQS